MNDKKDTVKDYGTIKTKDGEREIIGAIETKETDNRKVGLYVLDNGSIYIHTVTNDPEVEEPLRYFMWLSPKTLSMVMAVLGTADKDFELKLEEHLPKDLEHTIWPLLKKPEDEN